MGLLIFFVPSIFNEIFNLVPNNEKYMSSACLNCLLDASGSYCDDMISLNNIVESERKDTSNVVVDKEVVTIQVENTDKNNNNAKPTDANNNISTNNKSHKGQGWDVAPTFENTDCSIYSFQSFGNYINQYPDDLLENLAAMNISEVGLSPKKNLNKYWTGYLMETAVFVNNYFNNANKLGYDINKPMNTDSASKLLSWCWSSACIYTPKYAYLSFDRVEQRSKLSAGYITDEQKAVAKKAVEIVLNGEFTIPSNISGAMGKSVKREGKNILYQSASGQIFFSKQNWKTTDIYGNGVSLSQDYYHCLGNALYDYYFEN